MRTARPSSTSTVMWQVSGQSWGQTAWTRGIAPLSYARFLGPRTGDLFARRLADDGRGPAVLVDRHHHDFGLGHRHLLPRSRTEPLGLDLHPHRDGRPADPNSGGVEADDVPREDRLVELDGVHRLGHVPPRGMTPRLGGGGEVDVRQDDSAEDGAEGVGVPGEKDHADRGIATHLTGPWRKRAPI